MKTKILIVENDLSNIKLIQHELKKGVGDHTTKIVQTENEYEKALHDFKPDIILSNYTLPNFDWDTIFKLLKKIKPETPFIFITKYIDKKESKELVKNGVTDFVQKDQLFTLSSKIVRALKEIDLNNNRLINVKKIMEYSLDVLCTIDEEGNFIHVSAASESLWGYKPEELIGKKYIDLVFHEDVVETINADIHIKSNLPTSKFENRYIHKDGSIVPILWSASWDDKDKLMYCMAKNQTESISLKKAFKIERQRFHDLYSQAPSCMGILKGPNHIFEFANPLFLQLIGKTDIIGKTLKEVSPELEVQGVIQYIDRVYKTGETFSAKERLIKFDHQGDGNLLGTYLNFVYQAHRDSDDNIDSVFFFANDVTEQVVSRKKIEESLMRYTSLIEQASDAICIIDPFSKIIEVNQYACDKLGYSKEEFIALSTDDLFSKEDLMANPLKKDVLKKEKTIRSERRFKRKDNTLIEVELSAKIMEDGNTILIARDITEQNEAQQALKKSEKKYRQIVETAEEGIWLIDETNKTTFINSKMAKILGYTREEMRDKEIYSFMDKKGKQILVKVLLNRKELNKRQGHFKFITKKGKEVWTRVSANTIFDENGIYKGGLAMVTDITESKKAEENLEKQNKELAFLGEERENRAAELLIANHELAFQNKEKENRAAELLIANRELAFQNSEKEDRANELIITNRDLIKTNIELDRFVYSVSHDLRSPLTSILGLISFIEEESKEADTLEHVNMIRNSINRLDEFIKKIISYSRNNRTGLEIEKIPLQKTAIDIVDSLQSIKEAKGINFDINIKEHHPFHSDKLRFNTILVNLISNAIKYHKDEKSNRYIKITGQSDHEILQITITDNGIGIAPAYHSKIFDMFFRLSGTKDGSGIGLYIVKDTLGVLQGTIKIHSEEGVGTAFTITLKNLKK